MRCYIAGRFSRREELLAAADRIYYRLGWEVKARWLTDPFHRIGGSPEDCAFNAELARHDRDDLIAADMVIYFSPGGTRGGCHVEFGMALALDKSIHWIGPREHVFSFLPEVAHHETLDHFIEACTPPECSVVETHKALKKQREG